MSALKGLSLLCSSIKCVWHLNVPSLLETGIMNLSSDSKSLITCDHLRAAYLRSASAYQNPSSLSLADYAPLIIHIAKGRFILFPYLDYLKECSRSSQGLVH